MIIFDIETYCTEPERLDPECETPGAIFPQYSRVVCVSFHMDGEYYSLVAEDEGELLTHVRHAFHDVDVLAGHNIKNFDMPFLAFRMLANNIELPSCLRVAGKKPWEIKHIDTKELLRFGSYRQNISLDDACRCLGIASPKEECDGSKVAELWEARDHRAIMLYCEADVRATKELLCRLTQ